MRNKPKQGKNQEELAKQRDNEVNGQFCKQCHVGKYELHHEQPRKYVKCGVCGHTIEKLTPHIFKLL